MKPFLQPLNFQTPLLEFIELKLIEVQYADHS